MSAALNGWIEVSEPGTSLVLRIGGELDLASRREIEAAVLAAVAAAPHVTLDLATLTFCDSNGIAMLIEAHNAALAVGALLTVRNTQPQVRRLFEITGVDSLLVQEQ
jgi:anti-sigma B factor antagonist